MNPASLNFIAIGVATVLAFVIGGLWYSPLLFAKAWMRECKLTDDDLKGGAGKVYGFAFLCLLIAAFDLAAFIGTAATAGFGAMAGLAAGLGWVAMSLGVLYLFERRSLKLWLINSGYFIVAFTVMGAVLGAWH